MSPTLPPITVTLDGQRYLLERLPIDDLPEWHAAHPDLVVAGRVHLAADDWPPIVLYTRTPTP
jgi:hypothetical protein